MTTPLDRFFDHYYRRRPVNASFIGIDTFDDRFPDYSDNGIADTISEMRSIREALDGDSIDHTLARHFLEIQIAEFEAGHFFRRNPSIYAGEAVFGVITSPKRLSAVPAFLEQARRNLQSAPQPWVDRALRECDGADLILRRMPGSEAARRAFSEFRTFLESDLERDTQMGAGMDFFALLMSRGHMFESPVDELLRFARESLERFRFARPVDDTSLLPENSYLEEHGKCWLEARALVEREGLFTWPDYPLEFTRIPEPYREGAPKLYYLSYRAPAPFRQQRPHRCEVNVCGPVTMKLNHVVHHAGPGHHVQNAYAYAAKRSRVGQIAAVDCACRTAMLSAGTLAEGWACYATDLLEEFGFCNADEKRNQEHTRLRMSARAVADIELHRGTMTFDEVERMYREVVGMSAVAARNEATRNSMFPGTAIIYLMGTTAIHDLRRKLETKMGLRAFHDTLLSYGSIPVSVIAREMTRATSG